MAISHFELKREQGIPEGTLEFRLFKKGLYISIVALLMLFFYDTFFTGDQLSSVIEVVTIAFLIWNLMYVKGRDSISNRHRNIFSAALGFFMNLGWITGGGISMLLASINFLALAFILVILESKYYRMVIIIFLFDYAFLFVLEYFLEFNLHPSYETTKPYLIKQYLITLTLYSFGGYLIYFLKINYNKERWMLRSANDLLNERSEEITSQNERLTESKQDLDQTVQKLEQRTNELISIKDSLEQMVDQRTKDLRKMNTRLLSQNKQLEQYAYIISHNLKAPVAQIKGLVHLLPIDLNHKIAPDETLKRLDGSVQSLEKVLGDLSLILQLEKGMQDKWQDINLFMIFEEVLDSLKESIKGKAITVENLIERNLSVKAIKAYVYSIALNIIENAVKYADEKKSNPCIQMSSIEQSTEYIITITDNGIGIDMKLASGKIFQMYQRFNNTHPGQGFGLFLVKSQMEAMEGKAELKSTLGDGTTINLYFPKRLPK
jgi:signal transduction histidine kinase